MKEKEISSTYLVAKYLKGRKKNYIFKMKTQCSCNNPAERIRQLRHNYGWQIETVSEGYKKGVEVFHYLVHEAGEMPKKFR